MFSLEKCKRIDPSLKRLTDEELTVIRNHLYGLAELALDDLIEKNSVSKTHERVLCDSE